MAGSENTPTLPVARRRLLATAAGLAAALAPAAALAAASSPDAELIRLCGEFERAATPHHGPYSEGATPIEDDNERAEAIAPLSDAQDELLDRICTLRATTLAGIKARAKTLVLFVPDKAECADEEGGYVDERMIAALLRDLVGRA